MGGFLVTFNGNVEEKWKFSLKEFSCLWFFFHLSRVTWSSKKKSLTFISIFIHLWLMSRYLLSIKDDLKSLAICRVFPIIAHVQILEATIVFAEFLCQNLSNSMASLTDLQFWKYVQHLFTIFTYTSVNRFPLLNVLLRQSDKGH